MKNPLAKAPRLYVPERLALSEPLSLGDSQAHYLVSVMRKAAGDALRVFNARDGEYAGTIAHAGKKRVDITLTAFIAPPPDGQRHIALYFAPVKKDRLAWLIEKGVELGVTDFHPVITRHTENRSPRTDKMQAQIVEAAEQCERIDMPRLHDAVSFDAFIVSEKGVPVYAAVEREEGLSPMPIHPAQDKDAAVLTGPEGGWSEDEAATLLRDAAVIPVTLGPRILRAETAVTYMLARL